MVRDPTVALPWHPISFVRQQMLRNSYSFLPVWISEKGRREWSLVSDRAVARYLRGVDDQLELTDRATRLTRTLTRAVDEGLEVEPVDHCAPDAPVHEVAALLKLRPVLVYRDEHPERLLGIVTAFDLL